MKQAFLISGGCFVSRHVRGTRQTENDNILLKSSENQTGGVGFPYELIQSYLDSFVYRGFGMPSCVPLAVMYILSSGQASVGPLLLSQCSFQTTKTQDNHHVCTSPIRA